MYKTKDYETRRLSDAQKEAMLAPFFDTVYRENGFPIATRNRETPLQKRGVDVFLYKKQQLLYVDEKCAVRYWQGNLNTFAFEIWSSNNGGNNGWFCPNSDYNITTDYSLGWVKASDENFTTILSFECMLINKQRIWNYLEKFGYTFDAIMKTFSENACYSDKNERGSLRLTLTGGITIVQSLHMIESPINLIISKTLLKELSDLHTMTKFETT